MRKRRVLRGGSYYDDPEADVQARVPGDRVWDLGFRVVVRRKKS